MPNPEDEKIQPQIQRDKPGDDDGPPTDVETEDKLPRGQNGPTADLGDDLTQGAPA